MPAASGGPRVWRDYDQAALDSAYDQAQHAPNLRQVLARYRADSDLARARLGPPERLAWGQGELRQLDLYRSAASHAPLQVFIHGGAWRGETAAGYGAAAELFTDRGVHYVVPDFPNVVDLGGDLLAMAREVQACFAWVCRQAASLGGDADRIHLSGHSSGAHLAAVLMTTDWSGEFGLPANVIKSGLLISGMYDLEPVRRSSRSRYVAFTDETEQRLSPQRHLDRLQAPVTLVHGSLETPEFIRQSRDFAQAARAAGKTVTLIEGAQYNHFEIAETLASPYGLAGRAALALMGLGQPG